MCKSTLLLTFFNKVDVLYLIWYNLITNGGNNMFIGTYEVTIDDKNRFFVPAQFRREISKELMITFIDEDLIIIFENDNNPLIASLSEEKKTPLVMEYLSNNTYNAHIDSQGRMLISSRDKLFESNIKGKAYIVGFGNMMKLYSEKSYLIERKKQLEEMKRLEVGESLKRLP